ncbi:MAG: TrkH family potassium uptake protein [Candidatus Margulisiibacteriota bacterium]
MPRFRAALIIGFSFLAVITLGAVLLCLPVSSANGTFTSFLDAYFTANSATCVTGLACLDTGTHFSLFGKLVILFLIQVGGLGYMTFSTFFMVFFRRKMFISEKLMMQEALNVYSAEDVINVLKKIFSIVFLIEGIGAMALFFRWLPEFGIKKAAFYGGFHAVSAFCNAGLSLFTNFSSFSAYRGDITVNLIITTLIILGGLGFLVITDIVQNRRFSLHSKIVVYTTLFLILLGTLTIFAIEFNHNTTLGLFGNSQKLLASYFQSVTTRTAGFNTIPLAGLRNATKLLMMGLMFIGASPGGTGGGIKTTTFILICATIWATLHESKNTVMFERKIPAETVRKAFAVFFLSISLVAGAIFLLNAIEPFSLMEIAFETFSAFGTVGLSLGITPFLSSWGKVIIIAVMFIGRVGTLSFLMGLSNENRKPNLKYPKEGISI